MLRRVLALCLLTSASSRGSFMPGHIILCEPSLASHANNQLIGTGDPLSSAYEGNHVCYTTEHGTSSAGCVGFSRAAIDTRRANAAAHHPAAE